jgi:ribosomal RNA small subunit methyltransferase RsmB
VDTAVLIAGGEAVRGFVNGVLRSLIRQKESLIDQAHVTTAGRFSHPQWWINQLQQDYPEQWSSFLEQAQQPPPMILRVNRRFNSVTQYQECLTEQGMATERVGEEGLRLLSPVAVNRLPGFDRGLVSVQDASAQLAVSLLGLHAGQRVLDACAAPGGKTAHMMERVAKLDLLALDKEPERVKRMGADMKRLGLAVKVECADAGDVSQWFDGRLFDRILLDAPCSGSGVVRRHPDIKWLRAERDIYRMAEQQKRLLDGLWPLLKRGGRLLYVTCSIFKEENRQVIDHFMQRVDNAKGLDVSEIYSRVPVTPHQPNWNDGQVCPDENHDGFYYAALQKI